MFEIGAEYRITSAFQAMRDAFKEGERLVYVSTAYSVYDSVRGYFFYDLATGELRVWDVHDMDDPAPVFKRYFALESTGWTQPPDFHVEAPAMGAATLGIHSPEMASMLPYTQALVEGRDGIENWYAWFTKNGDTWRAVLKRAEFLRYKFSPIAESRRILDALGVAYTSSHRHGWLDMCGR
jgi:hypothetical protein